MKKLGVLLFSLFALFLLVACGEKQDNAAYENFRKEYIRVNSNELSEDDVDKLEITILDYRDCDLIEVKKNFKIFHYIWKREAEEFHIDMTGVAYDEAQQNGGILIYEQNQ